VSVHYSIQSVDIAILQVYAERYSDAGGVCKNTALHQTEGGSVIKVKRGEGDAKVSFLWVEGTGLDANVPRGPASVAFGINLWPEKHGRPVKPMLRAIDTSFCRSVTR
jgi:hypothetical protein